MTMQERPEGRPAPGGQNVKVEFEDGIAWVFLNRPDKRNAMSPALNREMIEVLDALEIDERCQVLVLTGAGEAFTAGMDLKEYFREVDKATPIEVDAGAAATRWPGNGGDCMFFPKPTIAMVNGWCFGGGFTPLVSCDLAIAAEEAMFGLSEINWGIIPAGNVTRAVAEKMMPADALYYLMTGETFDGRRAAAMRLVNEAVPRAQLRARTEELAKKLMEKNPHVLSAIKTRLPAREGHESGTSRRTISMPRRRRPTRPIRKQGRKKGMNQFLDEKSYRPGL